MKLVVKITLMMVAATFLTLPLLAQEEETNPRRQFFQTMRELRKKEMQVIQENPDVKQAVEELEAKKREIMIAADPTLADLYESLDQLKEEHGARALKEKGGKDRGRGKADRQGKGKKDRKKK